MKKIAIAISLLLSVMTNFAVGQTKLSFSEYSQMKDNSEFKGAKKYYNILDIFPDNSKILLVKRKDDGDVLYAALFLFYKDTMMDFMSSTIGEYRKYYPTDFGIGTAIKYACETGYRYFDFARSIKGSPNQEFKRRWSAETKQLYYQYYLNTSNTPDYDLSNQKYQKFIRMWKKVPVPVTKVVGPKIRRNIP